MSRIIAVDPGTQLNGWAVFEDLLLVSWGDIDLRSYAYAERFPKFIEGLEIIRRHYGFRELVMENVSYAWQSVNRNRNIAGLQVIFRAAKEWANFYRIPFHAYNPATWKASVLGDAHASKEDTAANIHLRFNLKKPLDEHEYDAIGIAVYHTSLRFLESRADKRKGASHG